MRENTGKIVIGTFYELPDGRVARTCGWSGSDRKVSYYFDTDEPMGVIHEEKMASWVLRDDLFDFPSPRDPRLPYSFDLHWDMKHLSELKRELVSGSHEDIEEIREMADSYGLAIAGTSLSNDPLPADDVTVLSRGM